MRSLAVSALALLTPIALAAQGQPRDAAPNLAARIPQDSQMKTGVLPNGIRYYIRKNVKPEKRAELRLAVNAGSILETDAQRGYAHFVEHMAFNGTTNFAKNDLVKYLQSIGVRFGADLNAYTSFDETVYILPIPTDTTRIVDQAFTILEDWARGLRFDSTEAINERGVVREEWRGTKGAGDRIFKQVVPIALKNSLYAQRDPIGTEEHIMGATAQSLRAFYSTWYRPDLMAVVAVGDFDVADIERRIRAHFSRVPGRAGAPRPTATVPPNVAPLVAIASDKEYTSNDVSLLFKLPRQSTNTVGEYRRDLVERLYLRMFNSRLSEITQKPDAPFVGAGANKGGLLARDVEAFSLDAGVQDGGVERGLEALVTEARRIDRFGFLATELERAKTNVLRGYERAHAERDKTESVAYAEEYLRNYFSDEVVPGIEWEYRAVQRLLPTITLDDVNKLASQWITDENRIVIVQGPEKAGVTLPTEAQVLAALDRGMGATVVAYTESVSDDALITSLRPAGRVVASRTLAPGAAVTEWRLSNGARVLFKVTDFKADEILFSAYSDGGTGLAPDSNYMSAAIASQIVSLSGLGEFNRIDLGKKLAGKAASVGPSVGEMHESLNGQASPKDLETLFQLAYLHFTGARLDTVAWQAFRQNVTPYLENRGAAPEEVFSDTVLVTMAQYHFRSRPLTTATVNEINPHRAIAFFRDRFADASDFTFVFVGTIDTTALRPLVERYLASLPSTGRRDVPKVASARQPSGVIDKTVRRGIEKKATTVINFSGPCAYSPQMRLVMRALVDAFQLRLDETLREQLGGTYSPSVGGSCSRRPHAEYGLQVRFDSSDDNVERLTRTVFALIDTMQTRGPSVADVEKVREQIARSREVDLKRNGYWISGIASRDQNGESIDALMGAYDDMVKQLTPAQIQAAARQYFDSKNYARFVLLPLATTP